MVNFSFQRLFRFLRSIQFIITILIISCLLTSLFVLYQRPSGPGNIQRIGWQSWDTVSKTPKGANAPPKGLPGVDSSKTGASSDGVDWWNDTHSQDLPIDSASLPLDVWAPLLPHDTGLSAIEISRCMFDPRLVDFCAPSTNVEQDAKLGKWVRVERNLNQEGGMWNLNIYYRRTRRLDVPLIVDLRLLPEHETPSPFDRSWQKASRSIRDGVMGIPQLFLWYRMGKTLREMTPKERQEDLITELDVLFGEDRPWYGFERLDPPVIPEIEKRVENVWVTYRRGVRQPPTAPPLHFDREGKFKILQIADLHYSVSRGQCRDTIMPCNQSDNVTSSLIGRVLDAEKPSLVVFTGDQLNGQGMSWDPKSVLAKFAIAVTDRGIPWAAVFGNHDDEGRVSKEDQMKLMRALPYGLVEPGPRDVHGVGNYILKVRSADASKTHLLTLYFLDSGSYAGGLMNWWGWLTRSAYDWIRQSQIDWFLQESASIKPIERPFSPDTGKDFGSIWRSRQADPQLTPAIKRLAKPNALMFFHIPLQESYSPADLDPSTSKPLDTGIHGIEARGSALQNDGFFEKGILKAMESDHTAGGNAREVKVIANGHCHITENCRRVKGVWLCFGGGGSYSGYGRRGFDRRFRIYDISDYGETVRTYKRTENDKILDDMVLAGTGAPRYEGS